jgi:uncharacterized membrane protein
MPSTHEESNTTTATPTVAISPEAKSPLAKTTTTTTTELIPTQLYIDTTKIENETQLTFQTHKVQELITKQISLEYGVGDIMAIITLLIALGAMMISLVADHISSSANKWLFITVAVVILLAVGGYACYAQYKVSNDQRIIQNQITQTINAIQTYKEKVGDKK